MEAKDLLNYVLKVTFWSKLPKDEMGWYKSCIKLKNLNLLKKLKTRPKMLKWNLLILVFLGCPKWCPYHIQKSINQLGHISILDNKIWKEIYTCLIFIFWNLDGTYALKATWNENCMPHLWKVRR